MTTEHIVKYILTKKSIVYSSLRTAFAFWEVFLFATLYFSIHAPRKENPRSVTHNYSLE